MPTPEPWNEARVIAEADRTVGQRIQAAGIYLQGKIRQNVSVPGTAIAGSSFVGLGRTYTIAPEGPLQQGMTMVEGSRSIINAFGIKGKTYKKGRRIYGANPSRPGEFPRKQFGTFRASVTSTYDPVNMVARVGSPSKVGRWLELGTRKMLPRPWLRRTLAEERQTIARMIGGQAV